MQFHAFTAGLQRETITLVNEVVRTCWSESNRDHLLRKERGQCYSEASVASLLLEAEAAAAVLLEQAKHCPPTIAAEAAASTVSNDN